MTASDAAVERIARATASIRTARETWSAASPQQIEDCRTLLDESITELRAVEDRLRSGTVPSPAALAPALLQLKEELTLSLRLTDAGLSFYRGVALRTGGTVDSYGPGSYGPTLARGHVACNCIEG